MPPENKKLDSVKKLCESFSLENLSNFLFANGFKVTSPPDGKPCPILEKFKDKFENCYMLGELSWENGRKLGAYGVLTKAELTERSSKKAQFEVAKVILNYDNKDCGLFVFYDANGNFRFSLIYKIYKGTKASYSYYRRYTYYVEKGKPYRTFLKALSEASFESLEKLIEAFRTQPLTEEFYTEIQNWFAWALEEAKAREKEQPFFPGGRIEENLIRLITRLIFVWFLKEKKLIPEEIFDEKELEKIVKDFRKADNYYNVILQNLFFATLNRPINEREFADQGDFNENRKHFGVKSLYRYKDKILISEADFIKIFEKVPFVNGGLFECLDEDKDYIDGFSRNEKKRAKLPDELFFGEERKVDLTDFYGEKRQAKVRGLIKILKDYNFTADESTPVDIEVSLDPELLGHIFENLLASYNPETQTTARKATGSYYTPKEVVDFMVEESLVEYFKTKTEISEEKIRNLLSYSDEKIEVSDEEKKKLITAIDELRVLDPAVGSGAFPMGIVHKLVHLLDRIDPDNELWREHQRKKSDKSEREQLLKEINENFDESINYPDFARKLYIIQNCIYGVDIQPIAIQICKLRFFLSLLIDQKVDFSKENFGVKPLPHLETKFVTANTLIGLKKQGELGYTQQVDNLREKLLDLYNKHFSVKTREEKKRLQDEVKKVKEQLKEELEKLKWNSEDLNRILSFDIFSQTATADWFDPKWMFGFNEFDIVIGNPPYIQLQKAYNNAGQKYADLYKDQGYETFDRMGDIYCLFYEKGINLLKDKGVLCFISSNKWMRAGYGEKLRKFFVRYNPKLLVDLGPGVFENATVDTCIFLIQKANNENALEGVEVKEKDKDEVDLRQIVRERSVILKGLGADTWFIGGEAERKLKEKIERIGKPLREWDLKIYYGIKTGLNEAFIITTKTREEILANCRTEEERKRTEAIIKPILRGRDIKRYYYEWAGLWIIGTFPALKLNIDDFPALKKYFLDNFDIRQLEQSGKKYPELGFTARKKTGNKWYETQDQIAYYPEFEKEKVVWQELAQGAQFALDDESKFYVTNTGYILTGARLKYIVGYLNSKLNEFVFNKWYCTKLGEKGTRWLYQHVQNLPLPPITPSNQEIVAQIESRVNDIIEAKKKDKNADTTAWEREIDQLVYKLYGLTPDEIMIIEENSQ